MAVLFVDGKVFPEIAVIFMLASDILFDLSVFRFVEQVPKCAFHPGFQPLHVQRGYLSVVVFHHVHLLHTVVS